MKLFTRVAGILVLAGLLGATCGRADNLVRKSDFSAAMADLWSPSQHVSLRPVTAAPGIDRAALEVSWNGAGAFINEWGRAGNLAKTKAGILSAPLRRDTRYRLSCRMLVERLELTPESKRWYAELPAGQYDPPTVTLGCRPGYWNSGMPWLAYDMSKAGTWQTLTCEFTTPFHAAGGFLLTLDVYPSQQARITSSGKLYLTDVRLEPCWPLQVGFTKTNRPIRFDGSLEDWWETNPVVITSDQVSLGPETRNTDASGVLYTMWDESWIYVAAKVIDDQVTRDDGIVVHLDDRSYVFAGDRTPADCRSVRRADTQLGRTANLYRIVSQLGESVRERGGYIMEMAIPRAHFGRDDGDLPRRVAFEIRDADASAPTTVLRYPYSGGRSVEPAESFAEPKWANARGELRGGERPIYAITDAGNDRSRPRALAIKHIAVQVIRQGRNGYPKAVYRRDSARDRVDAIVSWTTTLPATGRVEYGVAGSLDQTVAAANAVGEPMGTAMRVVLRGLDPDTPYEFRVVAHLPDSEKEIRSAPRPVGSEVHPPRRSARGSLRLTVRNESSVDRHDAPVTTGIPLPRGVLGDVRRLQLVDPDAGPVAAQFTPLAEWPDGSIQWVLIDFQTSVEAQQTRSYELRYGVSASPPTREVGSLRVTEGPDAIHVDTGAMRFTVSKTRCTVVEEVQVGSRAVVDRGRLVMLDDLGQVFIGAKPEIVEIEEVGPLRVCIRIAGTYRRQSESLFDYELRIHAYAGSSRLRVTHNYTCHAKRRTDPVGGRFRPDNPVPVPIGAMWVEWEFPRGAAQSAQCGIDSARAVDVDLSSQGVELRQSHERRGTIGAQTYGRLPGWISVGPVTVAVRHFWQLYPKGLSLQPLGDRFLLRIETHPRLSAGAYDAEAGSIEEHVWGYLQGGKYRLRRGEGRRHELWFDFDTRPGQAASVAGELLAEPLIAVADPRWYAGSGAFGNIAPRSTRFADYDRRFREALERLLATRESEPFFERRFGRYGLRNFGDNFGSDGMNWDNVEYDLGHACLIQFVRTGDLLAWKTAREILEHNMDVDCVTLREGFEYLCHHTRDHNAKLAGIGHTWCEGVWEYYFLTGDRRAAQKAIGIANRLARATGSLTASGQPGAGGSRDYGWSVIGLAASYRATSDPLYLNAAREIVEVAVRTQHPFRGG